MNTLPLLPANIVDICGSGLAIFLSFLALRYSKALVKIEPNNFIWGFLFYFCVAMAAFPYPEASVISLAFYWSSAAMGLLGNSFPHTQVGSTPC